ncbi:hypothetical protein THA_1270 [Thermosipho africanus TCF52B]|uniref:Uncharacterized protein n=1 Tax=Thermosipho africanus (strain TCF52B) TaxID=484019 RepID=B7II01_THEAB|nr:hypothetical protein THA_1270 [Thermosipho africanus TCF52B]
MESSKIIFQPSSNIILKHFNYFFLIKIVIKELFFLIFFKNY